MAKRRNKMNKDLMSTTGIDAESLKKIKELNLRVVQEQIAVELSSKIETELNETMSQVAESIKVIDLAKKTKEMEEKISKKLTPAEKFLQQTIIDQTSNIFANLNKVAPSSLGKVEGKEVQEKIHKYIESIKSLVTDTLVYSVGDVSKEGLAAEVERRNLEFSKTLNESMVEMIRNNAVFSGEKETLDADMGKQNAKIKDMIQKLEESGQLTERISGVLEKLSMISDNMFTVPDMQKHLAEILTKYGTDVSRYEGLPEIIDEMLAAITKFSDALGSSEAEKAQKEAESVTKMMKEFAELGERLEKIKSLGATIRSTVSTLVNNIMAAEKEIFAIAAIADMQTPQVAKFRTEMTALAVQMPYTTKEIAGAYGDLVRTGKTAEEAGIILQGVTKLAVATFEPLGKVSSNVNGLVLAMELAADKTEEVTKALFNTLNSTPLGFDSLSAALTQTGAAFNALLDQTSKTGLELEDYKLKLTKLQASMIGGMAMLGKTGSQAGTAIRNMTTRLASMEEAAKRVVNADLARIGGFVSSTGISIRTAQDLADLAGEDFLQTTQVLSEMAKVGALSFDAMRKLFTGRNVTQIVGVLSQIDGDLEGFIARMTEMGDLTQASTLASQSWVQQYERFSQTIEDMSGLFGDFADMFAPAMGLVNSAVSALSESMAQKDGVKAFVNGLTASAGAISSLYLASETLHFGMMKFGLQVDKSIGLISLFKSGVGALNASLMTFVKANPVLLIGAALAGIATMAYSLHKASRAAELAAINSVKSFSTQQKLGEQALATSISTRESAQRAIESAGGLLEPVEKVVTELESVFYGSDESRKQIEQLTTALLDMADAARDAAAATERGVEGEMRRAIQKKKEEAQKAGDKKAVQKAEEEKKVLDKLQKSGVNFEEFIAKRTEKIDPTTEKGKEALSERIKWTMGNQEFIKSTQGIIGGEWYNKATNTAETRKHLAEFIKSGATKEEAVAETATRLNLGQDPEITKEQVGKVYDIMYKAIEDGQYAIVHELMIAYELTPAEIQAFMQNFTTAKKTIDERTKDYVDKQVKLLSSIDTVYKSTNDNIQNEIIKASNLSNLSGHELVEALAKYGKFMPEFAKQINDAMKIAMQALGKNRVEDLTREEIDRFIWAKQKVEEKRAADTTYRKNQDLAAIGKLNANDVFEVMPEEIRKTNGSTSKLRETLSDKYLKLNIDDKYHKKLNDYIETLEGFEDELSKKGISNERKSELIDKTNYIKKQIVQTIIMGGINGVRLNLEELEKKGVSPDIINRLRSRYDADDEIEKIAGEYTGKKIEELIKIEEKVNQMIANSNAEKAKALSESFQYFVSNHPLYSTTQDTKVAAVKEKQPTISEKFAKIDLSSIKYDRETSNILSEIKSPLTGEIFRLNNLIVDNTLDFAKSIGEVIGSAFQGKTAEQSKKDYESYVEKLKNAATDPTKLRELITSLEKDKTILGLSDAQIEELKRALKKVDIVINEKLEYIKDKVKGYSDDIYDMSIQYGQTELGKVMIDAFKENTLKFIRAQAEALNIPEEKIAEIERSSRIGMDLSQDLGGRLGAHTERYKQAMSKGQYVEAARATLDLQAEANRLSNPNEKSAYIERQIALGNIDAADIVTQTQLRQQEATVYGETALAQTKDQIVNNANRYSELEQQFKGEFGNTMSSIMSGERKQLTLEGAKADLQQAMADGLTEALTGDNPLSAIPSLISSTMNLISASKIDKQISKIDDRLVEITKEQKDIARRKNNADDIQEQVALFNEEQLLEEETIRLEIEKASLEATQVAELQLDALNSILSEMQELKTAQGVLSGTGLAEESSGTMLDSAITNISNGILSKAAESEAVKGLKELGADATMGDTLSAAGSAVKDSLVQMSGQIANVAVSTVATRLTGDANLGTMLGGGTQALAGVLTANPMDVISGGLTALQGLVGGIMGDSAAEKKISKKIEEHNEKIRESIEDFNYEVMIAKLESINAGIRMVSENITKYGLIGSYSSYARQVGGNITGAAAAEYVDSTVSYGGSWFRRRRRKDVIAAVSESVDLATIGSWLGGEYAEKLSDYRMDTLDEMRLALQGAKEAQSLISAWQGENAWKANSKGENAKEWAQSVATAEALTQVIEKIEKVNQLYADNLDKFNSQLFGFTLEFIDEFGNVADSTEEIADVLITEWSNLSDILSSISSNIFQESSTLGDSIYTAIFGGVSEAMSKSTDIVALGGDLATQVYELSKAFISSEDIATIGSSVSNQIDFNQTLSNILEIMNEMKAEEERLKAYGQEISEAMLQLGGDLKELRPYLSIDFQTMTDQVSYYQEKFNEAWEEIQTDIYNSFKKGGAVQITKENLDEFNDALANYIASQQAAKDTTEYIADEFTQRWLSGVVTSEFDDISEYLVEEVKDMRNTLYSFFQEEDFDSALSSFGSTIGKTITDNIISKMLDTQKYKNALNTIYTNVDNMMNKGTSVTMTELYQLAQETQKYGLMLDQERQKIAAMTSLFDFDSEIVYDTTQDTINYQTSSSKESVYNVYQTNNFDIGNFVSTRATMEEFSEMIAPYMAKAFDNLGLN